MSNPKTTKTKGESSILPQIEQLLSEQTSVILHAVDEKLTAQDKRLEEKFVAQGIKAARELGMHRSTLVRTLRELNIDIRAPRDPERRRPHSVGVKQKKKITG
jgi:transcriptional regulator of acetoin/glycerol metabolism